MSDNRMSKPLQCLKKILDELVKYCKERYGADFKVESDVSEYRYPFAVRYKHFGYLRVRDDYILLLVNERNMTKTIILTENDFSTSTSGTMNALELAKDRITDKLDIAIGR